MRRDDNEPVIIAALEADGCTVYQLDYPADLLVWTGTRLILIEVKNPARPKHRRRLTKKQQADHDRWNQAPLFVCETPEAALAAARG